MKKVLGFLGLIATATPACAVPPPPPTNLHHFKVEGIAIECIRKPDETRLRSCRILASDGYVDVQIQRLSNDGTYYFWATRVCTLTEAGKPDWAKRTGVVHAGKLIDSDLPKAISELQQLLPNPECPPVPVSAEGPASYPFRLDKALIVLDNLWRG